MAEAECGWGRALTAQHRWREAAHVLEGAWPVYREWGLAAPDTIAATEAALVKSRRALAF